MKKNNYVKLIFILCLIQQTTIWALPIDWHGVLGFDSTSIENFRRIEKTSDDSNFGNANSRGTQELPLGLGENKSANWAKLYLSLNAYNYH